MNHDPAHREEFAIEIRLKKTREGVGACQIMRRVSTSKTCNDLNVWQLAENGHGVQTLGIEIDVRSADMKALRGVLFISRGCHLKNMKEVSNGGQFIDPEDNREGYIAYGTVSRLGGKTTAVKPEQQEKLKSIFT